MVDINEVLNDIKDKDFVKVKQEFVLNTGWKCDYCNNLCYGSFVAKDGEDIIDVCKDCYDSVIECKCF